MYDSLMVNMSMRHTSHSCALMKECFSGLSSRFFGIAPAKKKVRCGKIEDPVMTSEDPASGFIRFETDVSDITSAGIYAPAIEVMGTPWKLWVHKRGTPLSLDINLEHRHSDCDMWSVFASSETCLMNSDNPIKRNMTVTFDHKASAWGMRFIDWKTLVDEKKGFIKDGKIVVECRFTLSKFVGIRANPLIDFTDPNEPHHDITLVIDGEKLYANKGVLTLHSPVFKAMFLGQFAEKDKKEIELKNIDRKEFIVMLNLIYPSYEKITDAKINYVLKLADQFQMKSVLDKVEQFVIDSTTLNICSKLNISDEYRLVKLQDHCLDSLKTVAAITNLNTVDGYKDLSKNILATLMKKVLRLG